MDKWEELNLQHGTDIIEEYQQSNVLLADLARKYNVSGYIITRVLHNAGVKQKDWQEITKEVNYRNRFKQRTYDLNFNYFKSWSNNMAYVLGFLYADGNLAYDKHVMRIGLSRKDREHLEVLVKELGYTGNVVDHQVVVKGKQYDACYVSITSYDLCNDLKALGLYANKSLTIDAPDIPCAYEIDFIRGYFDGNGSIEVKRQIHKTKNSDTYQLRFRVFSGSPNMLKSITKILTKYGLKEKPVNKEGTKEAYNICYSTKESYKLYDLFYKEPCIYLPRKKQVFEKGFALRGDRITCGEPLSNG